MAWGQVARLRKQEGAQHGMGITGELVPSTWCRARATSTNILGAESLPTFSHRATAFVALEEHGVTSSFLCPMSCSQRPIHQGQVGKSLCVSSGFRPGQQSCGPADTGQAARPPA